jgi:hypothetical protein
MGLDRREQPGVALGPQVKLAQHDMQFRLGHDPLRQRVEVSAQALRSRARRRGGRPEATGRIRHHRLDQLLLRGEVVVDGGVIQASVRGDAAHAQALEALPCDHGERGGHQ